jgi:hypothetical protein
MDQPIQATTMRTHSTHTLFAADLLAAGTAVSPTINGVAFVGGFAPTGWTKGSTLALQGSTTGDAGYDQLLSGARATSATVTANPTGWGAIRLDTLGALGATRSNAGPPTSAQARARLRSMTARWN